MICSLKCLNLVLKKMDNVVCSLNSLDNVQFNLNKSTVEESIKVRKNAKIRNQYNKIPCLTQDTIWKSDQNTRKHHTQNSLSQQVTTRLQGTDKTA